jgi:hypothetical protein
MVSRYNVGTGPVYRWNEEAGEMRIWAGTDEKQEEKVEKEERVAKDEISGAKEET